MAEIELIHENCFKILPTLKPESFDLILTDPPYNITACEWDKTIDIKELWKCLNRLIKPTGVIAIFGKEPFSSYLRLNNIKYFRYDWIWQKSCPVNFLHCNNKPLCNYEIISIFTKKTGNYFPQMTKGKKYIDKRKGIRKKTIYKGTKRIPTVNNGTRYPTSILKFKKDFPHLHPTQKPVSLLEYLIRTYTKENYKILDPFLGSGSTAVAAKNTNRQLLGIEKELKFIDISRKRLDNTSLPLFTV